MLKLRTDHLGKFAPREINPLYGSFYMVTVVGVVTLH